MFLFVPQESGKVGQIRKKKVSPTGAGRYTETIEASA
jgi:hypothetical protein